MTTWIIISFLCVPLNYAMLLARTVADDHEWNVIFKSSSKIDRRRQDMGMCALFALIFGVFGPIGLLGVFCMTGFAEHGLKWRL